MRHENYTCNFACPIEAALEAISGKWKGVLLYHLLAGERRFNELQRLMPGITQRVLAKQLRSLEDDQIIHREVYPEVPPRVEYSLTEFGRTLEPILNVLQTWGEEYLDRLASIRKQHLP